MSTRRTVIATAGAVALGAVAAPETSEAAVGGKLRTAMVYDLRAIRGWATGDASGIFPADPEAMIFPGEHFENADTKLEILNLLDATRLTRHLYRIEARRATRQELLRVHTAAHIDNVLAISALERGGLIGGPETPISHNGHILAELAFGGAIELALAVWERRVKNGYVLMRPPGHHATKNSAMGFCIYNNVAGAAMALLNAGAKRLLVFDWDVHHGNGTYDIFKDDPRVVIVDMHQRECFPPNSGHIEERGVNNVLNLDLPPGTGHETALYAMDKVVIPAIKKHNPEAILVSSGFDSGITDQLGRFMFGAKTFREMTKLVMQAANNRTCKGRIIMVHEGGYEKNAVPEFGLAVLEELSGIDTGRAPVFDVVVDWQNAGIPPEILAVHRDFVDKVAALVPEIPAH